MPSAISAYQTLVGSLPSSFPPGHIRSTGLGLAGGRGENAPALNVEHARKARKATVRKLLMLLIRWREIELPLVVVPMGLVWL